MNNSPFAHTVIENPPMNIAVQKKGQSAVLSHSQIQGIVSGCLPLRPLGDGPMKVYIELTDS